MSRAKDDRKKEWKIWKFCRVRHVVSVEAAFRGCHHHHHGFHVPIDQGLYPLPPDWFNSESSRLCQSPPSRCWVIASTPLVIRLCTTTVHASPPSTSPSPRALSLCHNSVITIAFISLLHLVCPGFTIEKHLLAGSSFPHLPAAFTPIAFYLMYSA